jgi:riboflavin kinase/FMN adenylyltransferase
MKVISGLGKVKTPFKKVILTLGIFDGVHLGHQYLLKKAVKKAKSLKIETVVLTFWPHPQLTPTILTLNQRLKFISQLDIDYCIVVQFTKRFSSLGAEDFIKIIVKKFRPRGIFVGEDFRFGKGAKADTHLLKDYAKKYIFSLYTVKPVKIESRVVSSTLIRNLIKEGNLKQAAKLLGRPVIIEGEVIKGRSIGRIIGYPTANIKYANQIIPQKGVYAVKVIFNKRFYHGLCYIGRRPTFKEPREKRLNVEVHIFNFKQNIYHQTLTINFIKKLRPELRFRNPETLAKRIKKDELKAAHLIGYSPL